MRILVTIPDEWVPVLDEKRGIATRTAWIRHQLEPHLKEAVAPLVPAWKPSDIVYDEGQVASDHATQFAGRGGRMPTLNEFDAHKAKPKARRKKVTVGDLESDEPIDLMTALKASVEAMKSVEVPDQPVSVMNRGGPALPTQEPSLLPARCNRGACTGTINPVSGRCLHCNQTPLKESK